MFEGFDDGPCGDEENGLPPDSDKGLDAFFLALGIIAATFVAYRLFFCGF